MLLGRIVYVVFLVASFVFSSFYGGYIPELIRYMLMVFPFLLLAYICLVYINFKPRQKVTSTSIVKGQETGYVLEVRNPDILPYINIKPLFHENVADIFLKGGIGEISLLPRETLVRQGTILCKYAGTYNVGIDTIDIPDFVRMFHIKFRLRKSIRVHVKPEQIHVPRIRPSIKEGSMRGTCGTYFYGKEIIGHTVRDYIPGDSPRKIHWKNSAKLNKLVTRQSEDIMERNTDVVIDTCMIHYGAGDRIAVVDKILHIVVAIADSLVRENINFTLRYAENGRICGIPIHSVKDYEDFYDRCANINFVEPQEISAVLAKTCSVDSGTENNVVVITSGAGRNCKTLTSLNDCVISGCMVTLVNVTAVDGDDAGESGTYDVVNVNINDDICEVLSG